jgi:hypothetical protein
MHISRSSDTIIAGDTAMVIGMLVDSKGKPLPQSAHDSIVWTLDPATVKAGDQLINTEGDTTRFTTTAAYRKVTIKGTYRYKSYDIIGTATLYIKPAASVGIAPSPSIAPMGLELSSMQKDGSINVFAGLPEMSRSGSVALFSVSGKKLIEKSIGGAGWYTINLGTVPSGAYLLRLNAGGRTIMRKVSITRRIKE